jgi:hypothetical protein
MAELKIRRGSIEVRVDETVGGKKVGVQTRIIGFDYDDLTEVSLELDESSDGSVTPAPELVIDFKGKKPKKQKLKFNKAGKKYE